METRSNHRQCPECGVKLTRYEWSKLWWMSGLMSGRLVIRQPDRFGLRSQRG